MTAKHIASLTFATSLIAAAGCSSHSRLVVDEQFPVPIMEKTPVRLGVLLDDDLLTYVHEETIENKGTKRSWEVSIGTAQEDLFHNLALGVFEEYEFVDSPSAEHLDGVLKPSISEVQFSLPQQTRSDYYEVWIRYQFHLFDRDGTKIGEWNLPAYGKAKDKDFGSKLAGMQAAAIAACRDAMAFFSINFGREKVVYDWIQAGKPLQPLPQATPTQTTPVNSPPPVQSTPTGTSQLTASTQQDAS